MKRHPSLIPLSHDHHQCLIIANFIHLNSKNFNADKIQKCITLLSEKKEEFLNHMESEESVLFPLLIKIDNSFINILDELIEDHYKMKGLVKMLLRNPQENDLIFFKDILKNHVRKEERVLFEEIQKKLDDENLRELANQINSSFHTTCRI